MTLVPDTKDWTWVLDRPCPECGLDTTAVAPDSLGARLRGTVPAYTRALAAPGAGRRPRPDVWSPLEYSCHVRDVHRLFTRRVRLMLTEDEPRFANWDQDATAVEAAYSEQHPATVADELVAAAEEVAATYESVPADAWGRGGLRSDGSRFTVASLGRYHLHDVVHHVHDLERGRAV